MACKGRGYGGSQGSCTGQGSGSWGSGTGQGSGSCGYGTGQGSGSRGSGSGQRKGRVGSSSSWSSGGHTMFSVSALEVYTQGDPLKLLLCLFLSGDPRLLMFFLLRI